MWAIDRTNLMILGIVLGVVVLAGLVLLLSPEERPAVVSAPTSAETIPVPNMSEPIVVVQPAPEPVAVPAPDPEPAAPVTPSSSEPIVDGIIHTGEYAHAMEAGGFRVYWSNDATVLRMGLFSPGSGYVAIGLDPERRMQGANFIKALRWIPRSLLGGGKRRFAVGEFCS